MRPATKPASLAPGARLASTNARRSSDTLSATLPSRAIAGPERLACDTTRPDAGRRTN